MLTRLSRLFPRLVETRLIWCWSGICATAGSAHGFGRWRGRLVRGLPGQRAGGDMAPIRSALPAQRVIFGSHRRQIVLFHGIASPRPPDSFGAADLVLERRSVPQLAVRMVSVDGAAGSSAVCLGSGPAAIWRPFDLPYPLSVSCRAASFGSSTCAMEIAHPQPPGSCHVSRAGQIAQRKKEKRPAVCRALADAIKLVCNKN